MRLIKKVSVLMVILCLTLSFVGCAKLEITFPDEGNLESIVLSESSSKNNTRVTITETEEINNILNSIKSNSRKTYIDSVGETPINIEHYITLEFLYSRGEGKAASVDYMYKKKDKYYIEQPYVGIWKITEESYNNINTLINQ